MGRCFENGTGIEEDHEMAALYYELAVSKGDGLVQFHLGKLYEAGKGVEKDMAKATAFYGLAASQGVAEAKREIEMKPRLPFMERSPIVTLQL